MQIEIKNIHKAFGRRTVLEDVTFQAAGGSCIGIIGANGCGKSTLFSILAGVQHGTGSFLADGVDLMQEKKQRIRCVGYIPQGTPLLEELTAWDNLLLWYSREELQRQQTQKDSLLHRFGVDGFLHVQVRKMSGGMKKRLSILCSVASDPAIILMDEPTAALDIICKETIKNYIAHCKAAGKIVILSTHEPQELAMCDRIYILKDGVLNPCEYSGDIGELAERIK